MLAVRFVDRIGKGVRTAPRDALIARSTDPSRRAFAFGFHRGMDNLGAVFGPLVATAILAASSDNLRLVFAVTLVPGMLSILAVLFGVREPVVAPPEGPSKPLPSLRGPVPERMRSYLAIVAVFSLANASDSFLILRARALGVPVRWIPLAWGGLSLLRALAAAPGGRIADRIGRGRALTLGWCLYAVAYAGFGFARTPWVALASVVIYGAYYGLTEGTERALVASLARDDELGRAYGYFNLVTGMLALPASLAFGWLYPLHEGRVAFGLCAALAAVAALCMAAWSRAHPYDDGR